MNDNIPNDPFLLLSFINMKLRDFYPDLEELCKSLDINRGVLEKKLSDIDYEYSGAQNQFV